MNRDSVGASESWLSNLPSTWRIMSPKALFAERNEPSWPDDVHLTPSQTYGVLPQTKYMELTGNSVVLNLQGQDNMKHAEPDDFIIHLRSFQGGLERSAIRGKVSTAYTVLNPRDGIVSDYYRWLLKSNGYIQELRTTTNQLRDGQSIKYRDFAKVSLPVPPVSEQRAIADYLNYETVQIDTLITEQQRLVEMLQERRASLITRTLTEGVAKDVDLVGSRHPLIGKIPKNWEVVPLRYSITFQEGPGILAVDFRDEGVPLLRVSSVRGAVATLDGVNYLDPSMVRSKWNHFRVQKGDLLISASASMGTISEVTTDDVVGAIPYTGIIKVRPGRMIKEYIRWFFVSGIFLSQVDILKTGSTIQHFGPSHLRKMKVPLPPSDEQRRIAEHLDREIFQIDSLIVESERLIELSKERREALITAAVTGQIDVPQEA